MRTITAFCAVAIISFLTIIRTHAGIITGPITNPTNGHDYYLLTPNTWSASEKEAEAIGGTLAIIKNAAEQEWVFSKFGSSGGSNHNLWIGFRRMTSDKLFAWMDGSKLDYCHWSSGQPDNFSGVENSCEMLETGNPWGRGAGEWNDSSDDGSTGGGSQPCGVVEVSGDVPINDSQRALVGDWYAGGRADHPCHITETKDALFTINEWNNANRIVFDKKGFVLEVSSQIHGEIVEDKILWSNGRWWSRKATNFSTENEPMSGPIDGPSFGIRTIR